MHHPSSFLRHRRWSLPIVVGLLVSGLAVRAHAEDPLDLVLENPGRAYPNLVPTVVELKIDTSRTINDGFGTQPGLFLKFDARAQNLGDVPLQLTVDKVDDPQFSTISQCVSWRSVEAHLCRETEQATGFLWHDAHSHFHLQDFAAYQLRRLAPSGRPDYSSAGLIARADKVASCLADFEQVREDADPTRFYLTCVSSIQWGISPGWTDIQTLDGEGQNVSIAGIPNGRYALIVDMDYGNAIHETSDADNYVEVTIEISDSDNPEDPAGRKAVVVDTLYPAPDDRGTETSTTTTTTTKKKPKKGTTTQGAS